MYAMTIKGRSVKDLVTVVQRNLSRGLIYPSQLMGLARFGAVAGGVVLWATHPYGVNFISDTVKDIVSPPKPKPMED